MSQKTLTEQVKARWEERQAREALVPKNLRRAAQMIRGMADALKSMDEYDDLGPEVEEAGHFADELEEQAEHLEKGDAPT